MHLKTNQIFDSLTAMLDKAKGRNTGTQTAIVRFNPELTLFADMDQSQLPQGAEIIKTDDVFPF